MYFNLCLISCMCMYMYNVLFNDALNTFYFTDFTYGIGHLVEDHSDSKI